MQLTAFNSLSSQPAHSSSIICMVTAIRNDHSAIYGFLLSHNSDVV